MVPSKAKAMSTSEGMMEDMVPFNITYPSPRPMSYVNNWAMPLLYPSPNITILAPRGLMWLETSIAMEMKPVYSNAVIPNMNITFTIIIWVV